MRVFYAKEAPGVHSVLRFADANGPCQTVAIFKKEVDARRFVDAANRSLDIAEEAAARAKVAALSTPHTPTGE
ncbi:hypothetical protein G6L26_009885 [Agrobacterium radiobacter]|uniref:hypothetical protein n=1 Tax=Agrobacterium tumefaciens complex TaxID=1183400 RepID=UPI00080FECA8|nr:hypothetical protein [Agrobacterium tumefaciens]NTA05496.1 hypothetical protein [Agrobacterium tumefaciens]NTA92089.1 hypothetical protein [Agrobacterium tumefaciens]OCJ32242.1 hypothetical protein A6U90_10030 [Agrobacterium tumefaciens]